MPEPDSTQLNLRSNFARQRVSELARTTGMTATQVIEEALRAYLPPSDGTAPGRLVRKGPLLVRPRRGEPVSLKQANAALDDVRGERS